MEGKIVVLGSLNMDIVVSTDRHPKIGETIHGTDVTYVPGGKGANQAVGIKKLGGNIDIIGLVGDDLFGEKIINQFATYRLDTSHIKKVPDVSTGIANIVHLPTDNSIIVIPGANNYVTEEIVKQYEAVIAEADVLLMQLEVPLSSVELALSIAKKHHVKTILNPAPAVKLSEQLLRQVDVITPNETELATLLDNMVIETEQDLEAAFQYWNQTYDTQLIVTLGEKGCAYWQKDALVRTPAAPVSNVVDTTGAGDSFNAAFAYGIAADWPLEKVIPFAVQVAGLSITKFGAQEGMPTLEDVNNFYR